ncbi:MAG: NYN domain-containing protein [Rubrivivax sp.]
MSQPERVMLLMDADNVSVDVMEQAIRLLLNQHGGLHVRRAYCTAESAVKHQAAFKRLAIKPMVNLAAGKNSTDIALAVDAIDLVLAERPDVVVIASSDSDFAPLVQRLREKGCVVRGIGQKGKTGDETQDVYDDYTVLEHRKAEPAARAPRKTPARKTAARKSAPSPAPEPAAEAPARKTPARKREPARKVAEAAAEPEAPAESTPPPPAKRARKTPARKTAAAPEPAAPPPPAAPADPRVDQVLAVLPELAAGQALALNVAVQRLREARLLGRNAPSTKFFAALADRFELVPAGNPTRVLLRS